MNIRFAFMILGIILFFNHMMIMLTVAPEVVVRIQSSLHAVLQKTLQGIPEFWKMPFYMSAINYICKAAKILQYHFTSRRFTAVERRV